MAAAPSTMQWLRRAAHRISVGSGRLTLLIARRISRRGAARLRVWSAGVRAWLKQASGIAWLLRVACLVFLAIVARKAFLAVAAALAGHADALANRLIGPLSLVWILAAYRIGHEDWEMPDEDDRQDDEEPAATPAAAEPAGSGERPLPTHWQLAIALHEVGAPHAQLVPLAAYLGTTTDRVRQACTAAGIRIRGGVRMDGRSVSPGIAAEDFPPRPPLPAPSHQGADGALLGDLTSNNNDNNATTLPTREGLLIITDDSQNPFRHHVHHIAKG
ncbi:hypothetical protein [Streptomyces longwoodensis]|uniref:hypothetical protein n=1 Tax=Streptomyces longwoodensis TaxID=68231 RepID=UPI0033E76998